MRFKRLASAVCAVAMAASVMAGLAVTASAKSLASYDFEAGDATTPFTIYTGSRVDKNAIETGTSGDTTKVLHYTSSGTAQNGSNGGVIYTKVSDYIESASFDFNIVDNGYTSIALAEYDVYASTLDATSYQKSNNLSMHTGGIAFSIGRTRQSSANHYDVNNAKKSTFKASTWYHAELSIDKTANTVTYNIYNYDATGNYSSATAVASETKVAFLDKNVQRVNTILIQSSSNKAEAYLDNIVLSNAKADNIEQANYTVQYVLNDSGNTLIKETPASGDVGDAPYLSVADKAAFKQNNQKYIYVSDDAKSKTISDDGKTVVTVTVRKAATYTVPVNAVVDGVTSSLDTYSVVEGDPLTYTYSKYITDDKNKVIATCDNSTYSTTVTPKGSESITVPYTKYTGTAYFFEGENFGGDNTTVGDAKLSSGKAVRHITGSRGSYPPVTVTVPEAGIYTVSFCAVTNRSGSGSVSIYKNEKTNENLLVTQSITGNTVTSPYTGTIQDGVTNTDKEVTLAAGDKIIVVGGDDNSACDYILLTKTGEYPATIMTSTPTASAVTLTNQEVTLSDRTAKETVSGTAYTIFYKMINCGSAQPTITLSKDGTDLGSANITQAEKITTGDNADYYCVQILSPTDAPLEAGAYTVTISAEGATPGTATFTVE